MISSFKQLLDESDRKEYMLGQHGARSGEKPRGFPKDSAYANLGFYKKDPTEDIKREPGESIPEEVWRTIQIIINSFLQIHKIGKNHEVFNLMVPYVQSFEFFRKTIVSHARVLEVLESRRKRHEKLLADVADDPGELGLMKAIAELEKEISELEAKEVALEETMTRLSDELEADRPELLQEIINKIVELVQGTEGIGTADQIKAAFGRYTALVYGRREDTRGGLGRSYLLLDPIISFMRFYNNALTSHHNRMEREKDKVTAITSAGKHGKNILKSNSKFAMLNFMVDCISNITQIRSRRGGEVREGAMVTKYKEFMNKAYHELQTGLDLKGKLKFNILYNQFLAGDPGSEGQLKRFLIVDVQNSLNTAAKLPETI